MHTLIELCRSVLCTAVMLCELSLKSHLPASALLGSAISPSSQPGQSKSKLQFENHRGNSVILLTRIILNLIRQVRWPDVDRDVSAGGGLPAGLKLSQGGGLDHCRGHKEHYAAFKCQAKLDFGDNRVRPLPGILQLP